MKITRVTKTSLDDVLIIEPKIIRDSRGWFGETFRQEVLDDALNQKIRFVQENESCSTANVFRGFHFQVGDYAQSKLIRVIEGAILDIVVNLQDGSHVGVELSRENGKQIFIPRNYAHGFLTISNTAIIQYKCDNYYSKENEAGITVNDWLFDDLNLPKNLVLSDKDKAWPKLTEILK